MINAKEKKNQAKGVEVRVGIRGTVEILYWFQDTLCWKANN